MYNNCGIFTNDKPHNLFTQVNMTEVSNGNNNEHKMKSFSGIDQEISENSSESCNQTDYFKFGQSSVGFSTKNNQQAQSKEDEFNLSNNQRFAFVATEISKPPDPPQQEIITETEIKIERSTGLPFIQDTNGVPSLSHVDGRIVYSDNSIEEANLCLRNGPDPTPTYYECPYCNILMPHPKRFLIHVKWHSFGLTNKRRLEMSQELDTLKKERRRVRNMERISKNEAKNESEANFPCKDCNKIFINKTSLKRHRWKIHPQKLTRKWSCQICLQPATDANDLREHMAVHRTKDSQLYQCPECPKQYKFPHSLVKHQDTHLEKTHPCSLCSKLFGSPKQLARHMKLHEKFARGARCHCAYCGKGYYDAFTLQIHERNHTQEKPFSCHICNTAFSTNSSLQRHLKVSHSASKPHACAVCARSFASARTRDRHALRAHADPRLRTYRCALCSHSYFKPKDLRNHMYKAHPKPRDDPSD